MCATMSRHSSNISDLVQCALSVLACFDHLDVMMHDDGQQQKSLVPSGGNSLAKSIEYGSLGGGK